MVIKVINLFPEHGLKFYLREDSNPNKSDSILMYNTHLVEYFYNKDWKSFECTNVQSNLSKVYLLPINWKVSNKNNNNNPLKIGETKVELKCIYIYIYIWR